jgi:hypothetical protein
MARFPPGERGGEVGRNLKQFLPHTEGKSASESEKNIKKYYSKGIPRKMCKVLYLIAFQEV